MEKDECIKAFAEENKAKRIKAQEKEEKKQTKAQKEAIMTKNEWLELLRSTFNAFIRLRDKDLPCISCGNWSNRFDAGHYYSAGNHSFLRFDEDNVHKQCSYNCNKMKHGNLILYRENLIKKIGLARVERLDRDRNKKLELSIPEIKEMIALYKEKIKQLKQ